jgi:hypothetical protein
LASAALLPGDGSNRPVEVGQSVRRIQDALGTSPEILIGSLPQTLNGGAAAVYDITRR